jgi:hypothetical protein
MSISPFVKCICPSCFEEIYLGECKIVSGRTSGKVLKDPGKGMLARMHVEPLDGPKYTQELAQRQCTNPNCKYLLPSNIERVPNFIFVVVGDTFSGKSHYIASLIQQIKTDWMANTSGYASFTCLTSDVERTYMQGIFKQLYGNKQVLQPTQQGTKVTQEPLIYNLVVRRTPRHPVISVNLIIYDTSGEDYVRPDRLVHYARFALNTRAFIFVADPFTMTPLFQDFPLALQALLQPSFQFVQGQGRAADSLNSVIRVVERYRGEREGASLADMPVAVMVSKSDLFKPISVKYGYQFTFLNNPPYGNGIDIQDITTVDQEVQGLLKAYGQGDLLAATRRFSKIKFFATSATGEPPDQNGNFRIVRPLRCLDPILWILHELNIIRSNV